MFGDARRSFPFPHLIKVSTPPFGSDGLLEGNLHVRNVRTVPNSTQKLVGKPEHQQGLDHFFAQVVVDPVDLVFFPVLADGLVELVGGLEVGAEGFFDDEAVVAVPGVDDVAEVHGDDAKDIGRQGQIKDAVVFLGSLFESLDVVIQFQEGLL